MGAFTMPALGADMEVGTITEWLVKPGDQVQRGDIVAVVDTEKSTIEVEVFESGTVDRILVGEGEEVPVGTVLAHISAAPGATLSAPAGPAAAVIPSPAVVASAPAAVLEPAPAAAVVGPGEKGETFSPLVRHLAEKLGVDIHSIAGSGPGGSVTRVDVEGAAMSGRHPAARQAEGTGPAWDVLAASQGRVRSSPFARRLATERGWDLSALTGSGPGRAVIAADVPSPVAGETVAADAVATGAAPTAAPGAAPAKGGAARRLDGMRRATGLVMARSKREIPHYYLSATIDMSRCTSWLERTNADRPVPDRLVPAALLLKATAKAVAKVPEMNGFFVDGEFRAASTVHVGLAVSLRGGGLVAPAIMDTASLALDDLMVRLRDLVSRARSGVLRSSEVTEATITVTNLGDLGVDSVFGVIYPPQVALVGFGRITERVVACDGLIGVRPTVVATLSADHRASDGHRGGRFLAEIDRLLQAPEKL